MTQTVSATFKTDTAARETIHKLDQAGFTEKQVSLVAADTSVGQSFNLEKDSKAAEGGTVGGATGGLLGVLIGGLAATGAVAIPGVNVLVSGAGIAAAAGAGVGALGGGIVGGLIGMGIPEYEAKRYEDEIKNGAILVVVEAEDNDRADKAKHIFEHEDAYNIAA